MNWTQILVGLVAQVLTNISPQIRRVLQGLIADLREKAKATDNPWDDILVELLAGIFEVQS